MDPFGRQRGQADSATDSQHQRYPYSQSQQRLPSFRTLLSENGSDDADQATRSSSARHRNLSSSSRPIAVSPSQSRPAPMPSLSQGFDEFGARYPEQVPYPPAHLHRAPEYVLGSSAVSPCAESTIAYPGQPLSNHQLESYHPGSNLPPIGEIQDRRGRMVQNHSGDGNVTGASFPHDSAGNYSSLGPDSEHLAYGSRRRPSYDHGSRAHLTYPGLGPGPVTPASDYARYGQSAYQNATRGYSSMYGDTDYSSQPVDGSQPPNFGVLGDSNDPRNKRRRGNLPKQVTDILRAWFHEHLDHPYPTEEDKQMFIARTGLSISQISNWFINARRRQLPSLRNQVRSQEHGRSSRPQVMNERDHFPYHESSLSPR